MESKQNKKLESLSVGTYPGVLLGARTYDEKDQNNTCIIYTFY
jgi:hypothetical protein